MSIKLGNFKPEVSIGVGLAVATVVYATYSHALPSMADVRSAPSSNTDIAAAEKGAAWTSAGIVAAISLIARDPTVFAVGGATVIALSWWTRHANAVDPGTGKIGVPQGNAVPQSTQMSAPGDYGYADLSVAA